MVGKANKMTKKKHKSVNTTAYENRLKEQQLLLSIAEKEIYENITQCLCLARMQLGSIEQGKQEQTNELVGMTMLLIGKAVQDLRNLAKKLSTHN